MRKRRSVHLRSIGVELLGHGADDAVEEGHVLDGCNIAAPYFQGETTTWGWGPSHFVTKPIRLPAEWDRLRADEQGWETPIVRRAEM